MAEKMFDQEFVEQIVKAIVANPDDVSTERSVDEIGTLISLHVNAADMATIIGKDGRTAKALRTILRVLGARHSEHVTLKIIEPEGGRGFMPQAAQPSEEMTDEEEEAPAGSKHSIAAALHDIPQDEIA